ncbi:MAG TPA: gamma-glutamyl-gamma-aminobutyrate hydrolase family protein [Thermoanaerobaculia bacterium]|nr:gamma-glutamyl-gamma-aminobutyrate hydrolase family protein [Thermoanaerobaculia bacterium]
MESNLIKPVIGIGADIHHESGRRDRAFAYTTYCEAVRRSGAIPLVIPPQPENAEEVLSRVDGLLLAGGFDCDPSLYGEERHPSCETMDERRQSSDFALAKAARQQRIPTLGICLGLQMMNVAAGGTLIQDIATQHDTEIQHASDPENRHRHDVIIEQGTQLAGVLPSAEMNVNSSHHQAVRTVGDGLRVTAHAPDGIIEGVEDPRHPFYLGVQWHPEDMSGEECASTLFGAFIEAARRHAQQRAPELSPVGAEPSE